ncbi:MAG TPA: VOC family protein [Chitinophagaceae bacterium]|nr:VOC family protein [Chitinophagaceae bacterium]
MTTINAYIGFQGQAREAMEFYKSCIGGELNLMTVGSSPMAAQCPEAIHGQIMHSSLVKESLVLMATDMSTPGDYVKGNNIALSVNCSSEEEINNFFEKLSEGGKVIDSLKKQFWGGIFGVLEDKFGIRWMFNYEEHKNKQ